MLGQIVILKFFFIDVSSIWMKTISKIAEQHNSAADNVCLRKEIELRIRVRRYPLIEKNRITADDLPDLFIHLMSLLGS